MNITKIKRIKYKNSKHGVLAESPAPPNPSWGHSLANKEIAFGSARARSRVVRASSVDRRPVRAPNIVPSIFFNNI
jgi:hypothetical protein